VVPVAQEQQHPAARAAEEHLVLQVVLEHLQQQEHQTQAEVAGVLKGPTAAKQEILAVLVLLFFDIQIHEQFQTLVEG
jgi:hypothetical protein